MGGTSGAIESEGDEVGGETVASSPLLPTVKRNSSLGVVLPNGKEKLASCCVVTSSSTSCSCNTSNHSQPEGVADRRNAPPAAATAVDSEKVGRMGWRVDALSERYVNSAHCRTATGVHTPDTSPLGSSSSENTTQASICPARGEDDNGRAEKARRNTTNRRADKHLEAAGSSGRSNARRGNHRNSANMSSGSRTMRKVDADVQDIFARFTYTA